MSFWTNMLHCAGGRYYVGHTDNLDRRMSEHTSGSVPGFTKSFAPCTLVWSECFQTRDDAKSWEKRLKGWSRPKKLALIRGDFEEISRLARKGSPSTGSGQRER